MVERMTQVTGINASVMSDKDARELMRAARAYIRVVKAVTARSGKGEDFKERTMSTLSIAVAQACTHMMRDDAAALLTKFGATAEGGDAFVDFFAACAGGIAAGAAQTLDLKGLGVDAAAGRQHFIDCFDKATEMMPFLSSGPEGF